MSEKIRPEVYTVAEVKALLKTFGKRYPTPIRNAAMIAVAYAGGLRCAEVLALKPGDVRADEEIFIRHYVGVHEVRPVQECSFTNSKNPRTRVFGRYELAAISGSSSTRLTRAC